MPIRDDRPQYQASVAKVTRITPHMVRITLGDVQALDGSQMPGPGPADEFFGLWIPTSDHRPVKRYYTLRRRRPQENELDIDMLLHGSGPATEWAARAAVGEIVEFDTPRGHYAPPTDTSHLLLCGDATALPALSRIMEERRTLAETPPATLVIAVDDPADQSELALRPGDSAHWCRPSDLVKETQNRCGIDPTAYVWFSGEAAQMRAVRTSLRRDLNIPSTRWTTMGYWRRDSERWATRMQAAGPELQHAIEQILTKQVDVETETDLLEELLASRKLF